MDSGRTIDDVKGFTSLPPSSTDAAVADFTELRVYGRAHELVMAVFDLTEEFPPEHRYGITRQLRRAASSVPANLAEGTGRSSTRDLARFVDIALGSAQETRYFLVLSHDLGLIGDEDSHRLVPECREIERMLSAMRSSLRRRSPPRTDH